MKNGKIAVLTVKIKTESPLNYPEIKSLKDTLEHWWGDLLISVDSQESQEEDTREKPKVPEICGKCKWCHNKQCWFNDTFHGEMDGDVDVCFAPKHESIDKQSILDKYWEDIEKLVKEDVKNGRKQ